MFWFALVLLVFVCLCIVVCTVLPTCHASQLMVFFFVKKTYGLLIHIGFSKKNIFSVSEKPYGLVILMSFFLNI